MTALNERAFAEAEREFHGTYSDTYRASLRSLLASGMRPDEHEHQAAHDEATTEALQAFLATYERLTGEQAELEPTGRVLNGGER